MLSKARKMKMLVNRNYSYSFFLAGILKYLDINSYPLNNKNEVIYQLSLTVFIFSLISLLCLSHVIFYLVSYLLMHKYDIQSKFEKYPLIIKLINYYTKSTMFFLILNLIMGLYSLIFLILLSLGFLGVIKF
jgi:hypothetical protein